MKIIATDLDGTLLNENHQISSENAKAIARAQGKGIQVIVATGRSYEAARKPMGEVGLTCPIICLNGAQVYTTNGEMIRSVPLDKRVAEKIQTTCLREGVYVELFTNKGGFSDSREDFIQVMVDILMTANPKLNRQDIQARAAMRFQDEEIHIVEDYDIVFAQKDIEIYKMLAFSTENEKLELIRKELDKTSELAITSSGYDNLEFNHPDAQKGIALTFLASRFGIEMKDVMAIGDNYNDVSMLQAAGRGVAMGNADEAIKNICQHVTKTNKENGVAHAINELLTN